MTFKSLALGFAVIVIISTPAFAQNSKTPVDEGKGNGGETTAPLSDKGLPYKLGRLHLNMKTVNNNDDEQIQFDEADALFAKRGVAAPILTPQEGKPSQSIGQDLLNVPMGDMIRQAREELIAVNGIGQSTVKDTTTEQTPNASLSVSEKGNGWPLFRVDTGRLLTSEETPNQENKEQMITDRDFNAPCDRLQNKCTQPSKTRIKKLESSAQTSQLMSIN